MSSTTKAGTLNAKMINFKEQPGYNETANE
jgi:hypothetical protein